MMLFGRTSVFLGITRRMEPERALLRFGDDDVSDSCGGEKVSFHSFPRFLLPSQSHNFLT